VAGAASSAPLELLGRRPRGRWIPILGVVLVLATFKVSTAVLGVAGVAAGIVATIALLGVTRAGRASWHDLGLSRKALRTGLLWSSGFFALFASGFVLTAVAARVVPAVATWLENLEVSATEPRLVALHALVTIPLGTVLVEEVAFRSALPTLLGRVGAGTRTAIVASAVLFGLWHVAPSLTAALDDAGAGLPVWVVVLGTVVFTTTSGIGLGWLRHRSGSLLPAFVVHMATNSLGVTLLWFLTLGR
jgi:membrane protease YdiL (CAAX protease family)